MPKPLRMRCQTSIFLIPVFSSAGSGAGVAAGVVTVEALAVATVFAAAMLLLDSVDSVEGELTACGVVAMVAGSWAEATGAIFFVSEVICCTGFVAQPAKEIMARTKNRLRSKVSAQ
jgi:hypothetical protein